MKIPTYEIVLTDALDGVTLISLVATPANQRQFVKMHRDNPVVVLSNQMKQELTGPVLIPDQLIYRREADGQEYNITFSAPVIEEIRRGFHANTGNLKTTNIEHDEQNLCEGVVLNSWLLSADNRTQTDTLGFADLPNGTWFVTYWIPKVADWNKYVLSEQVKGFSIEAYLDLVVKMQHAAPVKPTFAEALALLLATDDNTSDDEKLSVLLQNITDADV